MKGEGTGTRLQVDLGRVGMDAGGVGHLAATAVGRVGSAG